MPWAAAGIEVAADAAPAGEGRKGVPVPGDGLVALGAFRAALGDIVRPVHGEITGEQEDLFLVAAQPCAERVAGMVPVVPVPQPVMDDPGPDRLVVAFPQVIKQLRVQAGVAAGAGLIYGPVCLAQDRDDVAGPGLQAAGAELRDGAAAADDVGVMPISA